jgi:hypothetical protein
VSILSPINPWYHAYTASGERLVTIDWQGTIGGREATFTLRGLGNEVLSRIQMSGFDNNTAWSRDRDYIWKNRGQDTQGLPHPLLKDR